MSNNKFRLNNFRVFDDNGAEFEIAPITILTGCNSSGKSSVIKAMMLLNDYFDQIMIDFRKGKSINLEDYDLDFINAKHNLGTFDKTVNKFSESSTITITCSMYSIFLDSDIDICFEFVKNQASDLNSGKLKTLKINYQDFNIFTLNGLKKDFTCNLRTIKMFFIDFNKQVIDYNRYEKLSKEFEIQYNKENVNPFFIFNDYEKQEQFLLENKVDKAKFANYELLKSSEIAQYRYFQLDKIFGKELKYGSLFYTPILDLLDKVEKGDISKVISDKAKNHDFDANEHNRLNRVIEDFTNSNFNYFIDYYRHFEDLFLENISGTKTNYNSNSFYSKVIEGVEKDKAILELRSTILTVNPDWQVGTGSDGEVMFEEIGGDDFDKTNQRFKVIYKATLKFSCLVDNEFKLSVLESGLNHFEDYRAKDFEAMLVFLSHFLYDSTLNLPTFVNNAIFIGSERINVHRLYSKDQNNDFTNTLFELTKVCNVDFKNYKAKTFLKKWLQKFDLADDVEFKSVEEGLGLCVYLVNGNEKTLLADEGYGVSKLLSILFKIELYIIKEHIKQQEIRDGFRSDSFQKKELCTIVIEEPESNLHPKLQSQLADMFVELSSRGSRRFIKDYSIIGGFKFIIETHSEYLIRKLQTLVARKEIEPIDISIEYINNPNPNKRQESKPQVEKINIKDDGRLEKPFGTGFFDEAGNLSLDLLTIKSFN